MDNDELAEQARAGLALVDRVKRLDKLYLAMFDAQDAYTRDPSQVNWRRFQFCHTRYHNLVTEWGDGS